MVASLKDHAVATILSLMTKPVELAPWPWSGQHALPMVGKSAGKPVSRGSVVDRSQPQSGLGLLSTTLKESRLFLLWRKRSSHSKSWIFGLGSGLSQS